MKYLLTNDDGIGADGLSALQDVVAADAEWTIVAPQEEQSGTSHRVTEWNPIPVDSNSSKSHAIAGTPVDCARIGIMNLATDVDWLLSGVNAGGNLGSDIYMSGTVAAAREAALLKKPAIAFSQYRRSQKEPINWSRTKNWVKQTLNLLFEQDLNAGEFWNVNFPDPESATAQPEIIFCPVDPGHHAVRCELTNEGFIYVGKYQERHREPGCDVDVCFSGQIAVSRVTLP